LLSDSGTLKWKLLLQSQLLITGNSASMRFLFAFGIWVDYFVTRLSKLTRS